MHFEKLYIPQLDVRIYTKGTNVHTNQEVASPSQRPTLLRFAETASGIHCRGNEVRAWRGLYRKKNRNELLSRNEIKISFCFYGERYKRENLFVLSKVCLLGGRFRGLIESAGQVLRATLQLRVLY